MGFSVVSFYITLALLFLWFWRARGPVFARTWNGWDFASMSSGLDGDGSEPPGAGGRSGGDIRARIASPWMQRQIRRWLEGLMIPAQECDDVAQDVTAAALRSAHAYDPARASIERWVNGITVNVAAHWHDLARHRREELSGEPREQEDAAAPADVAIGAEDDRLNLLEALQLVPPHLRAIVVAHDFDGIPMAEVAQQARLPESTAYKWRACARADCAVRRVPQAA